MTDMDKICKGCCSYENYLDDPKKYVMCQDYTSLRVDCPCQYCLIKMVCVDACDKFINREGY